MASIRSARSEREEAAETIRHVKLEASRHQDGSDGDGHAPRRFEAALEDLVAEASPSQSIPRMDAVPPYLHAQHILTGAGFVRHRPSPDS